MIRQTPNLDNLLRVGQLVKLVLFAGDEPDDVELRADDGGNVYSSQIQDVLPDDLVVSWPTDRGVQVPVSVGQKVALQMLTCRGIFLLHSEVVAKKIRPIPMLHIARSGDWSRSQLRRNVRLELTIIPRETRLVWRRQNRHKGDSANGKMPSLDDLKKNRAFGDPINALIRDLSAGGTLIASATPLERGDILRLRFPLGNGSPNLTVLAEVIWTEHDLFARKHRYKAGCKFLDLELKEQDRIARFIFAKQLELRRRGLL